GNWAAIKRVSEDTLQIIHRRLAGIDRQGIAAAQITETAAIIQSHDVVGVRMSKNDGIQPANILAQDLNSKFRCSVHHQFNLVRRDINRRSRSMVPGVAQKLGRIFLADDWNPLRGSRAEKGE